MDTPPGNLESIPAPRFSLRVPGRVNWIGVHTLYLKEVRRFLKVQVQTVAAPVVTTLLFYAVFALSLGGTGRIVDGVPYLVFLGPGLVMMAIAQNAFANTSSSIIISKIQGNIVDILMSPLSPLELVFGYVAAGVTRGVAVGLVTALAIAVFQPLPLLHPVYIVVQGVAAASMLSLLGVMGAIWAEKFDHIAAFTNFIITPLSFLSGTFYSLDRLPETARHILHFNPFFTMIDGFRYGFIGHSDGDPLWGALAMIAVNIALGVATWRMFATGYKLKA